MAATTTPRNPGDRSGAHPVPARIYLDHAATTVMRPVARDAFLAASEMVGNPTAQHTSGRNARRLLDDALEQIAADLEVPVASLVLTSGGTEADNLALRGAVADAARQRNGRRAVAVCATDHAAILETARDLAGVDGQRAGSGVDGQEAGADGQRVGNDSRVGSRELPVDADGLLTADTLHAALDDRSVTVVSAATVNNETGVVQDLALVTQMARETGTLVHTDAVQATGHVPLPRVGRSATSEPASEGSSQRPTVDMMTLSGHKIGAPVGIGLLVLDPDLALVPQLTGGGQQRGLRSGTLDAPHAAALAAALHETLAETAQEAERLAGLRARLAAGIREIAPDAVLTAPGAQHSPHLLHVMFPGTDQDSLLFLLDQHGIDASAGSACTAGVTQASHVLAAMGMPDALSRGALRFSMGRTTTAGDIEHLLTVLPDALTRARAVGSLLR
jgi:cysteine desulfurase